jgi:zinc protease
MGYEYYGYPSDFIFRYQKAVKETTIEDIQRVAKTYLKPDRAVILVVGNEAGIRPPLSSLGEKVITIELKNTAPNS